MLNLRPDFQVSEDIGVSLWGDTHLGREERAQAALFLCFFLNSELILHLGGSLQQIGKDEE